VRDLALDFRAGGPIALFPELVALATSGAL
jgi:hypothetical protein